MPEERRLPFRYALLIFAYAFVLFGFSMVADKPLSIHEARLPQLAREMVHGGPIILPHSGERPWLERPPVPIWIVAAIGAIEGGLNGGQASVWATRLPAALMGAIACVLTAFAATRMSGRTVGLLAGLLLASSYEFYVYAGSAEDDVYLAALLAACVACMAHVHAQEVLPATDGVKRGLFDRPLAVWLFFILAGLLHWVKGPMIGWMQLGAIVLAVMLLDDRRRAWRTWLWLPGMVLALVIGLSWHVYAAQKFPSYIDNVLFDFTDFGAKPALYYAREILWTAAPWTPFALLALCWTWRKLREGDPAAVLAWAWAVAVVLILSVPSRKHHHYLVPALCGWAWLSAIGLNEAWRRLMAWKEARGVERGSKLGGYGLAVLAIIGGIALAVLGLLDVLPGQNWLWPIVGVLVTLSGLVLAHGSRHDQPAWLLAGWLLLFAVLASTFQAAHYGTHKKRRADMNFTQQADAMVPADAPLFISSGPDLSFFLIQFYARPNAYLLHNPTFLLDDRITAPAVYVIAPRTESYVLNALGAVEMLHVSDGPYGIREPDDRWALYRLTFQDGLQRNPAPPVDVLQAMKRGEGDRAGPYMIELPAN